ncbi:ABC transporter substrate-binding protein [Nocardia sp. NPDC004860]|uniref:substrate-binding periplasmic protein n=1 Tax=Nocardia sp. NPDC004860 TaxID=3154557 RepID=UPI0033AD8A93
MTGELRLICADLEAPPLFSRATVNGTRVGYEPAAAELVGSRLGRTVHWVHTVWRDMVPALWDGRGDAIWCGQGITPARAELVDFTRSYAIFDESALVVADSGIGSVGDLAGMRVAAVAETTNLALSETFPDVGIVSFDGSSADVLGDMVRALRRGVVDAVVLDHGVAVPLSEQPNLAIAFTIATRSSWGVSVPKGHRELLADLDSALGEVIGDGSLERIWKQWMPTLPFPLTHDE